jgi:hypothetical protein
MSGRVRATIVCPCCPWTASLTADASEMRTDGLAFARGVLMEHVYSFHAEAAERVLANTANWQRSVIAALGKEPTP